jgi:hypothetical protein
MNEQQLAAVKQALEALEGVVKNCWRDIPSWRLDEIKEHTTALQSIISQDALDKKAENARELGLDYEPAPVKTYHDGKPWPVAPKPWVGLSEEEVYEAAHYCVKSGQSVNETIRAIEAKLKEKNT